jgi:hypothetical protein
MAQRVYVDPEQEKRDLLAREQQNEYWFYAKSFGCGWSYPSRLEGWIFAAVMTAFYIALMVAFAVLLSDDPIIVGACFGFGFFVWVAVLIGVCYWKGDPKGRECNW